MESRTYIVLDDGQARALARWLNGRCAGNLYGLDGKRRTSERTEFGDRAAVLYAERTTDGVHVLEITRLT